MDQLEYRLMRLIGEEFDVHPSNSTVTAHIEDIEVRHKRRTTYLTVTLSIVGNPFVVGIQIPTPLLYNDSEHGWKYLISTIRYNLYEHKGMTDEEIDSLLDDSPYSRHPKNSIEDGDTNDER